MHVNNLSKIVSFLIAGHIIMFIMFFNFATIT